MPVTTFLSRSAVLVLTVLLVGASPSSSDAAPPHVRAGGPNKTPLSPAPAGGNQAAAMITPFTTAPVVTSIVDGLQWAEGPMWNASASELVFTDVAADRIYRWSSGEPVTITSATDTYANGISAGVDGSWVVCEHKTQRVRRRIRSTWTTLASMWQGRRFNSPNDNVTRSDGNIYFTDPTFGTRPELGGVTAQQPFQGVYRIAPNGQLSLVDDALQQPNGIALDATGTKLYVADTNSGAITRYPVASDGSTGDGVLIASVPQPDGLTVDRLGYIYIAAQDGVRVLRSSGAAFGTIAMPEQPTNVEFGGVDRKRLFITARSSVYRVDLRIAGIAPP